VIKILGDRRRWIYNVVVLFCSMLVMGCVTFYMIRRSEQKWCATLATLTDGYTAPASTPVTERGRRLAQNLIDLRKQYDC
jgi:hypothetical protein